MWKSLTNFQQRALFGIFGSIVVLAAILASHTTPFDYLFLLLLLGFQAVALWEYYHIAKMKGYAPLSKLSISFASAYILMRFFTISSPYLGFSSELLLYLFGLTSFVTYFTVQDKSIGNLGVTVFGLLYVTLPLSLFIDLNYGLTKNISEQTPLWLIFLIVATKMTDTCAYFVGKLFGKRQIAPLLSPQKTVEGLIGGLIGSCAIGLIFVWVTSHYELSLAPRVNYIEGALLGLIIGMASVLGDLAESLLKRDAKVKDSSSLPGFGGVLDIVDSTLFTTPLLYIFLRLKILLS